MELYFSLKKGNEMAIIDITIFIKVISQSYSVRTLLDSFLPIVLTLFNLRMPMYLIMQLSDLRKIFDIIICTLVKSLR